MTRVDKIFEVGVMKTGTTSLGAAFRILGYKSCSWNRKASKLFKEKNDFSVLIPYIDRFEAFEDGPWHDCRIEDLDLHYPKSKFILLDRDNDSWIKSMEKHLSPEFNVNKIYAEYLQPEWITDKEAHINSLVAWKHNKYKNIRLYFKERPDDLLIFEISEGWGPLCKFLGKPIPAEPFPLKNMSRPMGVSHYYNRIIEKFTSIIRK